MKRKVMLLTALAVLAGGLQGTAKLTAQPLWLMQSEKSSVSLEIVKPNFKGENDLTIATSALFLSGRFPIFSGITLVGELPISQWGVDSKFGSDSKTLFGNPYLGVEYSLPDLSTSLEIGFRPPLVDGKDDKESASLIGFYSDFVRAEAFGPDLLTLSGAAKYQTKSISNIVFRLKGGPTMWLFTGDASDADNEFWLDYSAQVGYEDQRFSVLAGLTGSLWLSKGDNIDGESSVNQLGLSANVILGNVRPGVHFRLPLSKGDKAILQDLDFVFGMNLGVQFN